MRIYEVEYENGKKSALSNNLIAENMFACIYKEVNRHVLMEKITDHQFDEADVNNQYAFVTTSSSTKLRRQTTKGVSL